MNLPRSRTKPPRVVGILPIVRVVGLVALAGLFTIGTAAPSPAAPLPTSTSAPGTPLPTSMGVSSAPPGAAEGGGRSPADAERALVNAYPGQVTEAGTGAIRLANGSTMQVDDGHAYTNFEDLLDHADLADQLSIPYPAGCPAATPSVNDDPGRLRYEPFFKAMYGSTRTEVERKLRSVPWFGSSLRVTTVNGVDEKLALVAAELARTPTLRKYLTKPGGGYFWRVIAGTSRLSGHSFGIAVDINTTYSDYWRWNGTGKPPAYRNRIPCEIAKVFERHGFIWGAKWYHYDTMHFEYRPELL